MKRVLRCECGYETQGSEASVVAAAQAHAWKAHGMELSADLARTLARPHPDEPGDARGRRLKD